ncbi:MAG: glycosyltransferase family 4 protein [Tepidisphaeraceae bacterium]
MRVLFCSPSRLDRTLGAPKVIMELAEGLRTLGVECDLIGPAEIVEGLIDARHDPVRYAAALREYLHKHAVDYDVVDYDHDYLPYDRSEFPAQTLMVARSVLLHYHFQDIRLPQPRNPRAVARRLVRRLLSAKSRAEQRRRTDRTVQQADLFLTLNHHDRQTLVRYGFDGRKIVVVGVGLHPQRLKELSEVSVEREALPTIAFVGTFDYRKGCLDMPRIAQIVIGAIPDARLRLIGTAGLFETAEQVRGHFPRRLRSRIEVFPRFDPAELPSLLEPCSAGFFPSYIEGFGFGVLEMLAAGLPVVAYDAPGPPEMLSSRWLVRRGDAAGMARRLIELLRDSQNLAQHRIDARNLAGTFTWARCAEQTLAAYQNARASKTPAAHTVLNPHDSPGPSEAWPQSLAAEQPSHV